MTDFKRKFDKEEFNIFDDTPEFERKKRSLKEPVTSNKKYRNTKHFDSRIENRSLELFQDDGIRKSNAFSVTSYSKPRDISADAVCQSIELLKLEINDVKDREKTQESIKHIEIIDYMHKTEISNLQARHESQLQLKDQQINTIEDKLSNCKLKIKEVKSELIDKSNELEYFIKEESLRNKELEFKIKLEADKAIADANSEKECLETKLKKELDKSKETYTRNLNQLEKKIKRIKNEISKEFAKKLKQPCVKCVRLGLVEEQLNDVVKEKEQALIKIKILENQIKELQKSKDQIFMQNQIICNTDPDKSIKCHELELNDERFLRNNPLTSRYNQQEQRSSCFLNPCISRGNSQNLKQETRQKSIERISEKCEEQNPQPKNLQSKNRRVLSFIENSQDCTSSRLNEPCIVVQDRNEPTDCGYQIKNQLHTKNNAQSYNRDSKDIETILQKYSRSKGQTMRQTQVPLTILTQEDLNDYSQKYITENTLSVGESKEGLESKTDNSLIVFGSINKANDTPSSQVFTSKFNKSLNKFCYYNAQSKPQERQKDIIKSLKENFCSSRTNHYTRRTAEDPLPLDTSCSNCSNTKSTKNLKIVSQNSKMLDNTKLMNNYVNNDISYSKSHFQDRINTCSREVYHTEGISVVSKMLSRKNSSGLSNQAPTFAQESFISNNIKSGYLSSTKQ